MATDYQEAIRILSEQEKILQFDSFTSEDAWKLGNIMVEEIRNQGINLTVSIRKMNGHIVFAYASEGANLNHQNWTDRKFNMVSYMECSSLLATARAHFLGRSLVEDFGLNYEEYKLLCILSHNVGKVLTHTYITQQIWGSSWEKDIASLRVFMATLRKKLETDPGSAQYIQTHIGIGYRMLRVD